MELTLSFSSGDGSVVLTSTNFRIGEVEHLCYRGKDSFIAGAGSFTWTSAVQGIAALFLRYLLYRSLENQKLSGGIGSLAASLDYAISKQPRWLIDMFGERDRGTPNIRYIVHRTNSGRKRPGPVDIVIRPKISIQVRVILDGSVVKEEERLENILMVVQRLAEADVESPLQSKSLDAPSSLHRSADECPYPGLSSFEEHNAAVFFGREQERDELRSVVRRSPCVTLIGSSGSGKSSLINAGLIPYIKSLGEGKERWRVCRIRPQKNPFREILRTVAENASPADVSGTKARRRPLLREFFAAKLHAVNNFLLIIDQAEEFFTTTPAHLTEDFLGFLYDVMEEFPGLRVLFAIRSDFLGHLMDCQNGALWSSFLLPLTKMQPELLRYAIDVPARVRGVFVEDGLVARLIEDVSGSNGQLPLAQFVLRELWNTRKNGELTLEQYESMGGIKGALAGHCEGVYSKLTTQQKNIFPELVSELVHIDNESGAVTKRTKTFSHDAPPDFLRVVDALVEGRIVVRHEGGEKLTFSIEFIHEAVITAWHRVFEIVSRDKEFIQWRHQVSIRASQYYNAGKESEYLLGAEALAKALEWKDSFSRLEAREREFLESSFQEQQERRKQLLEERAEVLVTALDTCELCGLTALTSQISELEDVGLDVLNRRFAKALGAGRYPLRLAVAKVALGAWDGDVRQLLGEVTRTALPADVGVLVALFAHERDTIERLLWEMFEEALGSERCLALTALLAVMSKTLRSNWLMYSDMFLDYLAELDSTDIAPWSSYFVEVRAELGGALRRRISLCSDRLVNRAHSFLFASLFRDCQEELIFLCFHASATEIGSIIRLLQNSDRVQGSFKEVFHRESLGREGEQQTAMAVRGAYSGIALGRLEVMSLISASAHDLDAMARLMLFSEEAGWIPIDPVSVVESGSLTVREKYVALVLASYAPRAVTSTEVECLVHAFQTQPDAGVHASLGLLLDRWGLRRARIEAEKRLVEQEGGCHVAGDWSLLLIADRVQEFSKVSVGSDNTSFWLANVPITREQFSAFRWTDEINSFAQYMPDPTCPVVGISWFDVVEYSEWLTQQVSGLARFRLPYDREWRIAAAHSGSEQFWFGSSVDSFRFFGWYYANAGQSTQPVRSLVPSPRGLFDLHGNVWEWCADQYSKDGTNLSEVLGRDSDVAGDSRVLRGGSWCDSPNWCSLKTTSNPHWPSDRGFMFGSRLVMELKGS